MAIRATILERLKSGHGHLLPEIRLSDRFPYREKSGSVIYKSTMSFLSLTCHVILGKACFLSENELATHDLAVANECINCSPPVLLSRQAPRVLEHMAAHILFDPHIKQSDEPCGLCLQPMAVCKFYLKWGKGAGTSVQVDFAKSTCVKKINFLYAAASISTSPSPSSNVPLRCPICPAAEPCIWQYNLPYHMRAKHPAISLTPHEQIWKISFTEEQLLKEIWDNRHKRKRARRSKKNKSTLLVISEAHSLHLTLRLVLLIYFVTVHSWEARDVIEDGKSSDQDNDLEDPLDLERGRSDSPEDNETGSDDGDRPLEPWLSDELDAGQIIQCSPEPRSPPQLPQSPSIPTPASPEGPAN
jgi:hypothetical protein